MSYVNILKTGTDSTIWVKGLEFYRDEFDIMGKQLVSVAAKNTSEEATKSIEHFQNQFLIQQKNLSDLRHDVKNYVTGMRNDAKEHAGHIDEVYITQGNSLRERYEQLELIMNSLRHEFNAFLSKWM